MLLCNISSWTFAWNDIARTNDKRPSCLYMSVCDQMPWIITQTNRHTCMHACSYTHVHLTYTLTYMHTHIYTTHTCIYIPYTHAYFLGIHSSRAAIYTNKTIHTNELLNRQQLIISCMAKRHEYYTMCSTMRYLWLWNYDKPHSVLPWVTYN